MTVACTPSTPAPGERVTISQTFGGIALAPSVRVESVPSGSTVQLGPLSGVTFTPDRPGRYVLLVSGVFASTLVSESFTVYVSETMALRVGAARLLLRVANSIIVGAAVEGATADVSALVGESAGSIGVDLVAAVSELRAKFIAHQSQVAGGVPVHPNDDTVNVYPRTAPASVEDAIQQIGILRAVMNAHLRNSTQAAVEWHNDDDTANVLTNLGVTTLADAIVAFADARRVFEAHRVDTDSHDVADSVNAMSGVDKLSTAIVDILAALKSAEKPYGFRLAIE